MEQLTKDILAEQLTRHEGAVRVIGKFIIRSRASGGKGPILIAGTCFPLNNLDAELVSPQTDGTHELWDAELIIIPKRKLADGGQFAGYRIDQMLCGGFERDGMWGKAYWTSK